jgi:hypothetical protein
MQSLFELIQLQCAKSLGTVVHVGAGSAEDLQTYATFNPARVVFVEGDPDAAADLASRCGSWPWAQVLACTLAQHAGPLQWHRYNIASLNGPLDAASLSVYYPRLRSLGSIEVAAVTPSEVLAPLQLARQHADDGDTVLVLDVPGQELALIDAIDDELLQAFDHVIVRGCRLAYAPASHPAQETFDRLQARLFRAKTEAEASSSLWPVAAFALDRTAVAASRAEQRADELRAAVEDHANVVAELLAMKASLASEQADRAALAQAHQTLADELARAQEHAAALAISEAAAQALADERAAQARELILACNTQSALANERLAQLESASRSKAEFERIAYERHLEIQSLARAKADLEQVAHERHLAHGEATKALEALKAALLERESAIAQLTQSLAERTRMDDEQATRVLGLQSANQKLDSEIARLSARLGPADRRIEELESLNNRLVAESQDRESRQRLLDSEILKAEAQLELIKDVLLREKNF